MTPFAAPPGTASRNAVPPEFANETALFEYLGLSAKEFNKIRWYRSRMYRNFSIAKGSTKTRLISAPDRRLKHLQRRIAAVLDRLYRVRRPVHGFVTSRSVKTNAESHLRRKFLINLDIQEFFPTISEQRVKGLLEALGIDARVCDIVATLCCNAGHLPQGAPTSPVLSNMICFRMDKQLMALANELRCIYTRYADDITLSSHQPPNHLFESALPPAGRFSPDLLDSRIRQIFQSNGFTIHPEKAHYADRNSRRTVTGLKVNAFVNVDRRFVRNIRATLYSVETLGVEGAEKRFHDAYGGHCSLLAHMEGEISWLSHIKGHTDPVVRAIALRFNACFPDRQLTVNPTAEETIDRALWVVDGNEEQGTAVFLKDVGLVTAEHVVRDVEEVEVLHPSKHSSRYRATILARCRHRDLALLSHAIPPTEFFELECAKAEPATGDQTRAVGYPDWAPGDRLNIRPGHVSTVTVKSAVRLIEVTQKLTQGMSGGALLNIANGVIGIIHKGGPDEGRDFSIHIQELESWLAESATKASPPQE